MEYCKKCGAVLAQGANYCSACGTPVKTIPTEEYKVSADDLVKTVKKLIHEGNVRRILVKDEKGKTLIDMPVTIGVVGTILAPWLAALGVIGAMATNCTIVVEREKKQEP
jgi:CBS domain-containing protein